MITKYDLIHSYRKTEQNSSVKYKVSDDNKYLVNKESGEILSTIEDALDFFRKKLHCDFEGIYEEHVSLLDVIRCRECGTVIFTYDDERYDHNLCCPVCANYETSFDYYTEDDIKNNRKAHDTVEFYKKLGKEQAEDDKRYCKTGLYPHELWKKRGKKRSDGSYCIYELRRMRRKGLSGLHLKIMTCDCEGIVRDWKKIPLSLKAAKVFAKTKKDFF